MIKEVIPTPQANTQLTSARARRARKQLLRALSSTDDLVAGVSNAHDALTFHWNRTTRAVSSG